MMIRTCGTCLYSEPPEESEIGIMILDGYSIEEVNNMLYCEAPAPQSIQMDYRDPMQVGTNADNCECWTDE